MTENEEEKRFTYTYSAPTAPERREIEDIRRQYLPASEREVALEKLRSMDVRVKRAPLIGAAAVGAVGVLAFGGGMALAMEWGSLAGGIALSVAGAAVFAAAFFVRKALHKMMKR